MNDWQAMELASTTEPQAKDEGLLLILEDDAAFCERLGRAMSERGFRVRAAQTLAEARAMLGDGAPDYAVLDLKLGDGSGLDLVAELRASNADCRVVILTGYGNIASAVAAIKAGAANYLPKPADADEMLAALRQTEAVSEIPATPMSADRVRWEHIQRVYEECGHNVSATARRLRMHRRTLQRILAKHAPPE